LIVRRRPRDVRKTGRWRSLRARYGNEFITAKKTTNNQDYKEKIMHIKGRLKANLMSEPRSEHIAALAVSCVLYLASSCAKVIYCCFLRLSVKTRNNKTKQINWTVLRATV
jgi:hypothetical protein